MPKSHRWKGKKPLPFLTLFVMVASGDRSMRACGRGFLVAFSVLIRVGEIGNSPASRESQGFKVSGIQSWKKRTCSSLLPVASDHYLVKNSQARGKSKNMEARNRCVGSVVIKICITAANPKYIACRRHRRRSSSHACTS